MLIFSSTFLTHKCWTCLKMLARDKRSSLLSKKFERRCGKTLFVLEKSVIQLRTQEVIKSFTESQKQTKHMHTYIHIHTKNIHTHTHAKNIHTYTYTYTHKNIQTQEHTNTRTYKHKNIQTQEHTNTRTYKHNCI